MELISSTTHYSIPQEWNRSPPPHIVASLNRMDSKGFFNLIELLIIENENIKSNPPDFHCMLIAFNHQNFIAFSNSILVPLPNCTHLI